MIARNPSKLSDSLLQLKQNEIEVNLVEAAAGIELAVASAVDEFSSKKEVEVLIYTQLRQLIANPLNWNHQNYQVILK